MSGTSHFVGQSGTTKRTSTFGEGTSSDIGPVKRQKLSKYHAAAGLKLTLHGNVYQLKLLTLFLKRGLNLGYEFTLTTEMVEAEKFDDIVFGYTDKKSGKDVCRFLQAKHKLDETNNKITIADLLNERDGDFSIKKYFISYRKIKRNHQFKGYDLKDFTICTNINLDKNLANNLEVIKSSDEILHFKFHSGFKRYKINPDRLPKVEKDQLELILRRTSDLSRLANMLADHVFKGKCLELRDLFKAYHVVLGKKVIDIEVGKFRSEFIDGESDQLSVLEKFRSSFHEEYLAVSKKPMNENEFWVKMKNATLKLSSSFGKYFEIDPNPELTANKEALAGAIVKAIKKADKMIVNISREKGNQGGVIKDNIDKLAGYVFVKKEDENEKLFYFNSKFLDQTEKLPYHLEEFRTKFMEKLEDEGIEFSKMNEYKFRIAKFETCEEGQLNMKPSLPDDYVDDADIQGFFESFVLSVNQPNEKMLDSFIQYELGEQFKLINCEFMMGKLQVVMLNWMKDKEGIFLTNERGKAFFEEIRQNVSQLVLIGPTLVYRAMMKRFDISFREDFKALQEFLNSGKRVFNLISSCEDTILSSIKVLQTLDNLKSYQPEGSYIFMSLDSLLCIQDRVMEAFRSGTSNLLAIQCIAKKNEADLPTLYDQLSALLNSHENKKVILITTLENNEFAEQFDCDFSEKNHYKAIKDEKINLTDLAGESQEKILAEGKVIFLGKEVCLNAVVDAESTHLLSGEVLSVLIKNDKLELGKPPIDPIHVEVEDYFIDRTLTRYIMVSSDFLKEENFLVLDDENLDKPAELCDDYIKIKINSCHRSYTDIILISDLCHEYIKLCEEYKNELSIHWLKKEKGLNNRYIYKWQQSYGDLTKLRSFIDTSEQSVTKYTPNKITDISDKVVLVAAEPGMGKSVLLSHLSLKTMKSTKSPLLWIVRSNLTDHSNVFSKWLKTNTGTKEISALEAVKFLYKMIFDQDVYLSGDPAVDEKMEDVIISLCHTQNGEDFEITAGSNIKKNMTGSSLLQIKLFAHFFNKGKVVLLFDGFDEISPYYNDLVVKLLMVLKDTKVKCLWLTTRPYNILQEPENQLSTFAYTLQPFLYKDWHNFLKKYWTKNVKITIYDEYQVNLFINKLVFQFFKTTNDQGGKFTSIPLQILMLADMLSAEFKKSSEPFWKINKDALVNKLDLVTLYEKFLENKLDIELEKIISNEHDRKKAGALIDEKNKRSEFRICHEILAVCWIFKNQCEKVLSTGELEMIKKMKELISEAKKKTGVIVNIVDNKPEFIHRTFAEYFAAQFIWKKFVSNDVLKTFEEKVVHDIVIEMLIKNGAIQVSKFLASIAKKYFYHRIDFSTWEDKIKILLMELTNQIDDNGATKKDDFQSIKLLLGIIEFFLQKQEEENLSKILKNHSKIIQNRSPELLCVCAEMGYSKLARTLTNLNPELLKQHLSQREWSDSPLSLAAENGHLDIIKFLNDQFSYDVKWEDKNGQLLIQRIFRGWTSYSSKVLKSCLELNIIDCGPFKDHKGIEKLPIYSALGHRAPDEVMKLLIEKTDAGIVNVLIRDEYKLPERDIMLLKVHKAYDEPMKIIELAFKKGIDFSFCLNDVLCSFKLNKVCYPEFLHDWCPDITDFFDYCSSCNGYQYRNLQNLFPFPIIEHLLKAGAGYSYIDARCDPPSDSTYCIVKQMYDMYKLLNEIYNLHKQNHKGNDDPRQMLFRLIFNYIRSLGFEALEITVEPEELLILPHYQEECEHKSQILDLIFGVIRKSKYFDYYKDENDLDNIQNTMCISVPRKKLVFNVICDPSSSKNYLDFPGFKHFMTKLFLEYYIDDDDNLDLAKSTVEELKKCVLEENSAYPIPVNLDSYMDCRREIYKKCKLRLRYVDSENTLSRESFNKCVKSLLCDFSFCDVLYLHIEQCYKITNALDEISEKVIKLEEAFNKLLEMKRKSSSGHTMILDKDQILDILGLKNIVCEREDLQKLVSEISDTSTGVCDLTDICCSFNQICQQNVIPALEHCLKFSDESKRIFDLFKELHEGYENLICAVKEDNMDKVTSALQNVEQDFVKAIIHGQDEDYGSTLHYAALNGQADIINIFLDHGANPNLRLCNDLKKITHFSQAVRKMEKGIFSSDDFINWTPLYFAVLNNHEQIVQNLIERGADVDHVLNPGKGGYSPLHISALSCGNLKIARLLLKNGARYNVPNKEGKTPLNLATSGSDVEKLLRSIDELFRIVEEGETNAVNSVFEALDFDSWEAVLNAENMDEKTLLELTNNVAQKHIFKLLSDKLRFGEPRVRQRRCVTAQHIKILKAIHK